MNVSGRLLSERVIRTILIISALLVAVSFLFVRGTDVTRVLGATSAVLLAVLLKVVSELTVRLNSLERETFRLMSQVEDSARLRDDVVRTIESQQRSEKFAMQNRFLLQDVQQHAADLTSSLSEIGERISRADEQAMQQFELLREAGARRDANIEKHESLSPDVRLLMGHRFQQLPRSLSVDQCTKLLDWAHELGLEVEQETIDYLARKLLSVEASGLGRLAASTADGVFRALVARSVSRETPMVLEIGVLFGLNAAYLWETVGFMSPGWHQTLVDPFEGYYGAALDRFTGLPVTRQVTETNLVRVGAPPDTWRIIEGYSTDEWVRESVADRSYDMVFVDGDHSYEGVSFDVLSYSPLLNSGGILMIDDYRAPSWPGVTRFVDEFLAGESDFDHVGTYNRTAIFRRR